jgi:uncharacterized protein (TIGR00369 family)
MGQHPAEPKIDSADVLAQWKVAETRRRTHMLTSGVARPEQVTGLTGMQVFEVMFAGELPYPPISDTLDFMLIEATPGRAVFQGRPMLRHYNPLGSVHGGWIATLLDSCMGCCVHTMLKPGQGYTSLEIKVNFVRPVLDTSGRVRAEGRVIHMGRTTATAEGKLIDANGKLLAHGTTTCIIFSA